MADKFGFDDGINGLFVVVESEPLSSGCLTPAEIDASIDRLKDDLDRVGNEMKAALPTRKKDVL